MYSTLVGNHLGFLFVVQVVGWMTRGADLFTYCSVLVANPKGAVVFSVLLAYESTCIPYCRNIPGNYIESLYHELLLALKERDL